jgi:Ca2+/H+ antiporter
MFRVSVLLAVIVAVVLAAISHTTGSVGAFKGSMVACLYLALCVIARIMAAMPRRR